MQLQGTVSVLLAKVVNPNTVIPLGFSGFNLQHETPQSEMIQSVGMSSQTTRNLQTLPTTLEANQNGQHQNQGQVSRRDESLIDCNQSDQAQFMRIDQSHLNQYDQNVSNQHDQCQNDQIYYTQSDQSQSQAI